MCVDRETDIFFKKRSEQFLCLFYTKRCVSLIYFPWMTPLVALVTVCLVYFILRCCCCCCCARPCIRENGGQQYEVGAVVVTKASILKIDANHRVKERTIKYIKATIKRRRRRSVCCLIKRAPHVPQLVIHYLRSCGDDGGFSFLYVKSKKKLFIFAARSICLLV